MFFANNIIIIAYAKRREPGLFCQTCLSFMFSLHCFCPALFKLIREINDFVRAQAVPSVSFVKVFILHFFSSLIFHTFGSRANISDSEVGLSIFFSTPSALLCCGVDAIVPG